MSNTYFYIANKDGSKRWAWPKANKQPHFLRFYIASTWKQKMYSTCIRFIFKLKLQSYFYSETSDLGFDHTPEHSNWALFFGTPGPNNKKILFQKQEGGTGEFIKYGLSDTSLKIVEDEKRALNLLSQERNVVSFAFPEEQKCLKEGQISLSNLPLVKSVPVWSKMHVEALIDLSKLNVTSSKVSQWEAWDLINRNISELSHKGKTKVPQSILNKLILLKIDIDRNSYFDFHQSHGDFTPWNVFETVDKQLALIDWELSQLSASKGYDFFHFHIQSGILLDRKSAQQITEEIYTNGQECGLFKDEAEIRTYLSLYLLQHISFYALLYANQEIWHTQIKWQIEVWEELLNDSIHFWSDRKLFITDMFAYLSNKKYAGLKLHSGRPEDLNEYSDIDILLQKRDVIPFLNWIKNRMNVQILATKKRSNVNAVTILFMDGSRLHLDLIFQLKRKSVEFLSSKTLLANAVENIYGIKEASPNDTALYIGLFYGLNGSSVPEKYAANINHLKPCSVNLDLAVSKHYKFPEESQDILFKTVMNQKENRGLRKLRNAFNYGLDSVKSFFKRKGMIITLSGVDGAGKSTVIEELRHTFDKKYRKPVVVLRHRPSIVPILSSFKYGKEEAEKRSVATLPREGGNRSRLKSILRFGYYYFDYFAGQFYVYTKYVLRGYVVIYDRYYFDMINDSKRSNMVLSKRLTSFGYKFLLKPNFNFFLYAHPDVILARKQELDRDTITELTTKYKNLFRKLQGRKKAQQYVSINNEVLSATTQHIFQTIGNII